MADQVWSCKWSRRTSSFAWQPQSLLQRDAAECCSSVGQSQDGRSQKPGAAPQAGFNYRSGMTPSLRRNTAPFRHAEIRSWPEAAIRKPVTSLSSSYRPSMPVTAGGGMGSLGVFWVLSRSLGDKRFRHIPPRSAKRGDFAPVSVMLTRPDIGPRKCGPPSPEKPGNSSQVSAIANGEKAMRNHS
jgi:hypothetical protein